MSSSFQTTVDHGRRRRVGVSYDRWRTAYLEHSELVRAWTALPRWARQQQARQDVVELHGTRVCVWRYFGAAATSYEFVEFGVELFIRQRFKRFI